MPPPPAPAGRHRQDQSARQCAHRTRRGERQGARKSLALGRIPKQQSGAQGAGDPLRPVHRSMHLTPPHVVTDGWPRDGRRQPNEPSTLPSRDGSSTRRFERICPRLRLPPRRGFFRGPTRSRRKFTRLDLERHHLAMIEIVKLSSRKNSQGRKSVRLKPELVVKVVL